MSDVPVLPERSGATRKPVVAFVVNGTASSAMGDRAHAFMQRLGDHFRCVATYRVGSRVAAILSMAVDLRRIRPDVVYVLDIAYSGVAAAALHRLRYRVPVVVDTGDAIVALARSMGRSRSGVLLTRLLESTALAMASHVVVRGTEHERILRARGLGCVTTVQDGVDTRAFVPGEAAGLRERLAPGARLTIGLVGSVSWSPRLGRGYGWELVELLARLPTQPVRGILVGDGDGLDRLRAHAAARGVADRVAFVGRVPLAELPSYLAAMDVCISTQTNDEAGRVRTTGKLPLYLALGRFVLASDVGEAALVLSSEELVPYEGSDDPRWPDRLAERVLRLLHDPAPLAAARTRNPRIARERFDYDLLARRVEGVLDQVLTTDGGASPRTAATARSSAKQRS